MTAWLIFDDLAGAQAANATIGANLGLSLVGINAGTGEPDPSAQPTVRWAIPSRLSDGRWAFPRPDDSAMAGVGGIAADYDPAWFPPPARYPPEGPS